MLAGSVILGFVAGAALGRRRTSRVGPRRSFTEPEPLLARSNGRQPQAENARSPGFFARFAPELTKLKSVALSSLVGALREKVVKAAPGEMGSSLTQFFDNIAQKITGEPAQPRSPDESDSSRTGSDFESAGQEGSTQRESKGFSCNVSSTD